MLKEVQNKCIDVIDEYNNVNLNSVANIRDSVRDIKASCVKALDELKEKLNIKDIVNNPQIFKEFDIAYKNMGRIQNEKFKKNLEIFEQLNQQVSILVNNLIDKVYNLILETLKEALNEQKYNNVKIEISQRLVSPIDRNSIINQFNN